MATMDHEKIGHGGLEDVGNDDVDVAGMATNSSTEHERDAVPALTNQILSASSHIDNSVTEGWSGFLDSAQKYDEQKLKGWKSEMDNHLVFAGLFSAVVTGFVVASLPSLQENYAQTTAKLLVHISTQLSSAAVGPASVTETFHPQHSDVVVNALWVLSLALSLVSAFLAICVQQWLRAFPLPLNLPAKDAVRLRHSRFQALVSWQVPDIITIVPVLLQVAVVLFLVGLYVLLQALYQSISVAYAIVSGVPFILYACTVMLPLFCPSCPFKSPLCPATVFVLRSTKSLLIMGAFWALFIFDKLFLVAVTVAITSILLIIAGIILAIAVPILLSFAILLCILLMTRPVRWIWASLRQSRPVIPEDLEPDVTLPANSSAISTPSSSSASVVSTPGSGSPPSVHSETLSVQARNLKISMGVSLLKAFRTSATLFRAIHLSAEHHFTPIPAAKEDFWTYRELMQLPRDATSVADHCSNALTWAPFAIQFHQLDAVWPCLRALPEKYQASCVVAWAALYLGNRQVDSVDHESELLVRQPSLHVIRHLFPIKPTLLVRVDETFAAYFKDYLLETLKQALRLPNCLQDTDGPNVVAIMLLLLQVMINGDRDVWVTYVPVLIRVYLSQSLEAFCDVSLQYPVVCLFRCCTLSGSVCTFDERATLSMLALFNKHLNDIKSLDRAHRDLSLEYTTISDFMLSTASLCLIALNNQPAEAWESEGGELKRAACGFVTSLGEFVDTEKNPIRDVGKLQAWLQHRDKLSPEMTLIVAPSAVRSIAENLQKLSDAGRMSVLGHDAVSGLLANLLAVCEGEQAFEDSLPLIHGLASQLSPAGSPEDRPEEVPPESERSPPPRGLIQWIRHTLGPSSRRPQSNPRDPGEQPVSPTAPAIEEV